MSLHKVLHIKTYFFYYFLKICLDVPHLTNDKQVTLRLLGEHVRNLKKKLAWIYFLLVFQNKFHVEDIIDDSIVNGMLRVPEVGMTQFKALIEQRLVN